MKNLITGLLVASLGAAGGLAQASGKQAQKSASGSSVSGTSGVSTSGVAGQDERALIKDWPQVSKQAAQTMLDRYGQPDVVSGMMLIWKDKAPFTRITVTKDAVRHLFPMEHQDVLTEEISLAVPLEKVSELARFDGSILVDRTKGTVAARSDRESSNFLALNLADDIINGKRDADSARKFYADTLAKQMSGKSSAYTDKLNFTVTGDTTYPDSQSTLSPSAGESSGGSSGEGGMYTPETSPNSSAPGSSGGERTPNRGD